jgi:hypothetical protein
MRRFMSLVVALAAGAAAASTGAHLQAAPAPPTYVGIERTIESIRESWSKPGASAQPNQWGWNVLFDALTGDLRSYAKAENEAERRDALQRVEQIAVVLEPVRWAPAVGLRQELEQWLQPRVRLALARKRLGEVIAALPVSTDARVQANRSRWVDFSENEVGPLLRDYEAADSVAQRQLALRRVHEEIDVLNRQNQNQAHKWQPSQELSAALDDLFNQPNLDITADKSTVAPVFDVNLVVSGPVTRKGYTSQVTAGPKTGFGLLPSDDGIAFFNSQALTSVTPIWDFQNRIASDSRGQRAARLYEFGATTYDWQQLTVTTILKPTGLELVPSATHAIDAAIGAAPTPGGGLGRAIAGLLGFNRQKITEKVYEGAIGQFRQQIPAEAAEETQERMAAELARRNAELRSKYLIGNDTAVVRDFQITHLSLRSRPEAVFVGGLFEWRGAPDQRGADAPQPPKLASYESGVTADLHVGSLLTSAVKGLWTRDELKSLRNVMIVTKAVPPGSPPRDGVTVTRNVDYATFLKAVDDTRKAHDPRVTALRISRPQPPEFSTDARGLLVALIPDLELEVPAPEGTSGGQVLGVSAKVLRIKLPLAEVAASYQIDVSPQGAVRLRGKIEEFNPGTGAELTALNEDEKAGTPLTRFTSAFVLGAMGARFRSQAIDTTFDQHNLPGFAIRAVSSPDPTGWVRINLVRTTAAQGADVAAIPAAAPPAPVVGVAAPAAAYPPAVGRR